jgi:ribosomal-protein-alanine N-acetyltransferase
MTVLETPRLRLEPMSESHLDGLFAINSDPAVMRHITGAPESREATLAMIGRVMLRWSTWGFSWWSLIERETGEIIGAGGVQYLGFDPSNPHEIGWRLRQDKWGQGYASEAARHMAAFAFEQLDAPLLCAICHPENRNSSRLMERLGMTYRRLHESQGMTSSMYEITRDEWFSANAAQPR